jgi:hypothetical protein
VDAKLINVTEFRRGDLTRRAGDKETRFSTLSQSEHIERPHKRRFDRFDSIGLIVRRGRRTSEVIDF